MKKIIFLILSFFGANCLCLPMIVKKEIRESHQFGELNNKLLKELQTSVDQLRDSVTANTKYMNEWHNKTSSILKVFGHQLDSIKKVLMQQEPQNSTWQKEAKNSTLQKEAQNLTSQKEAQNSTLQKEAHNLTLQKKTQNSALQKEAQNSTVQKAAQNSPLQMEAQNSTLQMEAQNLTSQKETQNSTLQKETQNSTLQNEALNSTLQKEAQNSTLQKEAQNSTLQKEAQNLTLQKKTQNSALQKEAHNSTVQKEAQNSTLQKETQNSTLQNEALNSTLQKEAQNSTLQMEAQNLTSQKEAQNSTENCADVFNRGKKVSTSYFLQKYNKTVICDMETDGGGWLLIQQRKKVTKQVDFNRDWASYKEGFGDLDTEFWIGNEFLYRITNQKSYELRIDMKDYEKGSFYATYTNFRVGNEESGYKLHLGGFEGNVTDSFSIHNTQKFSTFDRDNDQAFYNCAKDYSGGFWFRSCYKAHLNGMFPPGPDSIYINYKLIAWVTNGENLVLIKVAMKIRPKKEHKIIV